MRPGFCTASHGIRPGRNWDLAGELQRHWEASGSVPDEVEARLLCYQIHVGLDAQSYAAYKGNLGIN